MAQEITVVATIKARPGKEEEVKALVCACAEASRQEATTLSYLPHQDLDDPAAFVFVERYTSRAALAEHEKTPHFLTMADAFKTLLDGPIQVHILRTLP
ncbi:putative quinol monooxygenase [Gluconacetobacter tumulisoli]|uniref:Antibiotic biosynthesis monooxygenase n=1 Tax=Gluconacetobacter tumulisoli TaxID=1286189 RepID=A0A7W4K4Z5_9PROT|nr:putative quinol monooxygenase [Gluconacetobacter tumulisoli]MBB2200506.1 antibiotic biosynthesis monooxygenase [Gluconacetobacter tumulisoli]